MYKHTDNTQYHITILTFLPT